MHGKTDSGTLGQMAENDGPVDDPAIGTIIMWGAEAIPAGWLVCDGRSLLAVEHPKAVGHPAFHSSADGTNQVPDLRGFFVRGVDDRTPDDGAVDVGAGSRVDMFNYRQLAANAPYSIQDDTVGKHQHTYDGFPVPTDSTIVSTPGFWSSPVFTFGVGRANSQQQAGGSGETRPINFYLRYIIFVGPADPGTTEDEVPLGAIALWGAQAAPESWLICNGQSQPAPPASETAALPKMLGGFGAQPAGSVTTPDLRGQFIRGVDAAGSRDLSARERIRVNGVDVGSRQLDAFQSHSHAFTKFPGQENYWQPFAQALWGDYYSSGDKELTGWTGLAETRPLNAAFHYIMKATRLPSERSVMPIGAILMWPGSVGWPIGWLGCDGMSYPINMAYGNLYNVIGDTFRPNRVPDDPPGSNDGMFYVPDLQGMFVRGLDDSGLARDPDTATRTNPNGAVVGPVLGSIQGFALTGHPHSVSWWPGEIASSGERFGVQGFFGGWQPLDGVQTQSAGAVETRPRNTAMNFIIKYSDWVGSADE